MRKTRARSVLPPYHLIGGYINPKPIDQAIAPRKKTDNMNITILARVGEYDVEIEYSVTEFSGIAQLIADMMESAPEVKPRPRFQGNNSPKVELPFTGIVEKTELVPAKDDKKEYCLAHVKHDDGTLVPVRYFPPLKTWRAGEKVQVIKGNYGPQLKEIEEGDNIPF